MNEATLNEKTITFRLDLALVTAPVTTSLTAPASASLSASLSAPVTAPVSAVFVCTERGQQPEMIRKKHRFRGRLEP
jgi:hypothetical protein